MTRDQLDQLATWYCTEFRSRTAAVEAGTAKIDWLDPGTRVSLTEVRSHAESLGITMNVQDTTDLLHRINSKRKGLT